MPRAGVSTPCPRWAVRTTWACREADGVAPRAVPYFDFVITMFLVFGFMMEFPILLIGLSMTGIVTAARLRSSRRYVALGIAIAAAVVTPGGDVTAPLILGGTMYLLFELTLLFIRRRERGRART